MSHRLKRYGLLPLFLILIGMMGCDSLFGSKSDPTTEEIFDAGENEPGLVSEVEYVPLFPFFQQDALSNLYISRYRLNTDFE